MSEFEIALIIMSFSLSFVGTLLFGGLVLLLALNSSAKKKQMKK